MSSNRRQTARIQELLGEPGTLVYGTAFLPVDRDSAFVLLDAAIEQGICALDTAHVYLSGESERMIGEWLRSRFSHTRQEAPTIITKGAHYNQDRPRVTPHDIASDSADSLARLRLDKVDLYLLHYDDEAVGVDEIIDCLNDMVRKDRCSAFGASNWSTNRLAEAHKYAERTGQASFAVSSPNFSLAEPVTMPWRNGVTISGPSREQERNWYQANGMPLLVWSSLAGGFFSGRFSPANLKNATEYRDRLVVQSYATADNFQRLARARQLGNDMGLSAAQVALSYVVSQKFAVYAVTGAASVDEIRANVAASKVRLTPEQIEWLELTEGADTSGS